MPHIYLDNSTTTRPDPRILPVMIRYLTDEYGNPGSPHSPGRRALQCLEQAREEVASLVGCQSVEIVFTASASEANNLAVKGVFRALGRRSPRVLVSAVEHVSVLHAARALVSEGAELVEIGVSPQGRVDLNQLSEALRGGAGLVSVMHGNGEMGTLQPVREIAHLARERGAVVHSDATLTAGLYPDLWRDLEVDLMTLSPHHFHGPKGIGALVVRGGTRLRPQVEGGIQEGGLRAGTPSVALAAGFGEAARLAREESPGRARDLERLAIRLRAGLEETLGDWVLTGDPIQRVPGHLSLCLRYVEGEAVLGLLDDAGIIAGSGSACTLGAGKVSHVLAAMGVDPVLARGSLEFCFGIFNTAQEADEVARILPGIVARLRQLSPLAP
ncbi:MAG: cysteine desulfurase [Acidobacteria bacterium]|nr:cysteine desulfurase [Acidobacteriota bacterium]